MMDPIYFPKEFEEIVFLLQLRFPNNNLKSLV